MITRVEDSVHRPSFCTDHSLVELILNTDLPERGQGLLDNEHFLDTLRETIRISADKYKCSNPYTRWEMIKCDMVQHSMSVSRKIATECKQLMQQLLQTIQKLESIRNYGDFTKADVDELETA